MGRCNIKGCNKPATATKDIGITFISVCEEHRDKPENDGWYLLLIKKDTMKSKAARPLWYISQLILEQHKDEGFKVVKNKITAERTGIYMNDVWKFICKVASLPAPPEEEQHEDPFYLLK